MSRSQKGINMIGSGGCRIGVWSTRQDYNNGSTRYSTNDYPQDGVAFEKLH